MTPGQIFDLFSRARAKLAREGWKGALRQELRKRVVDPLEFLPLSRVNRAGLLVSDVEAVHRQEKEAIRTTSLMFDASQVETTYPQVYESGGRFLRYALRPAAKERKGLVVLFHGHNAFLHMGPMCSWDHFDLLAPWDTFGHLRQGSWFWGERGVPFVESLIQELIAKHRTDGLPWFATGGSMGGFGALWHGIKFGANGVYAMCPQVDLAAKIADFGADNPANPYRHLAGEVGGPPDLVALAEEQVDLPPLFLVQNQYDHINPFKDHAWRLLDVYNRKKGWYGLRVHPSVGHGGDGKQDEAAMFFSLLLERNPPRRFPGIT